jgi:hypothetical protein
MRKFFYLLSLLLLNVVCFASPFSSLHLGIRNETAKPVFIENFILFLDASFPINGMEGSFLIFDHIHLAANASKDLNIAQKEQWVDLRELGGVDKFNTKTFWMLREANIAGKSFYGNCYPKRCSIYNSDFVASFHSHKPAAMIVIKDLQLGSRHPKYVYEIRPLVTSGCTTDLREDFAKFN